MEDKKPHLPKPESLEAKFKLMTVLPYDKRIKRKHSLVFGFICDWFHSDYGDALASVRHIVDTLKERDPAGIGLYTGDVHSALVDLVRWGYLSQQKGAGRAASRYVPVWDIVCIRKTPNTTEDETCVRENPNADVRENPNANDDSVRKIQNEDPLTGPGHETGEHVVGNIFEAAPVAPLSDGLMAADAGPASGDRFADFWKAWPRKHGKKKAEAEWRKMAPDPDQASHVIVTARLWADHYDKHDVDMKWIPEPANWLKLERYDEALPLIHIDGKGAAIAKAKANAPAKPEPRATGPRIVDIIDVEVDGVGTGECKLTVHFSERDRPTTWSHVINLEHRDENIQVDGLREYTELCRALGMHKTPEYSEELHRPVTITESRPGKLTYAAA